MAEMHDFIISKLLPIIEENGCMNICDYGCGDGELLEKLIKRNPDLNLTGIDYLNMYGENNPQNKKNTKVKYVERKSDEFGNLKDSGQFDLVISTFALHHYQYPVSELQLISNLMSDNGLLVIFDHMFKIDSRAEVTKAISSFISEIERSIKRSYHRHHYTLDEAKDLLKTFPNKIILAEELKNEMTEEEINEENNYGLNRNRKIQGIINKNATDYWKSVWLPLFKLEESLLDEYGIDYSSIFCICAKKI